MTITEQPVRHNSRSLIVALGTIAMLSGLIVVFVFQITLPRITLNKQRALERAVFTVLPEATIRKNFVLDESGLTPLSDEAFAQANVFAGYNTSGDLVGLAMEASARGYQDVVKVLYGFSVEKQCIIGITVLESTETPGLGDKVETDPDFLANFIALEARLNDEGSAVANPIVTVKSGTKTQPWEIDGISGATITSNAIGNALRDSTNRMLPQIEKHKDLIPQTTAP